MNEPGLPEGVLQFARYLDIEKPFPRNSMFSTLAASPATQAWREIFYKGYGQPDPAAVLLINSNRVVSNCYDPVISADSIITNIEIAREIGARAAENARRAIDIQRQMSLTYGYTDQTLETAYGFVADPTVFEQFTASMVREVFAHDPYQKAFEQVGFYDLVDEDPTSPMKEHSRRVGVIAPALFDCVLEDDAVREEIIGLYPYAKVYFDNPKIYRRTLRCKGDLHDVGKLAYSGTLVLPDSRKPGRPLLDHLLDPNLEYTEFERTLMTFHPAFSSALCTIRGANFGLTLPLFLHHENWNGGGYYNIKGTDVPLSAWFLRVADIFDAMNLDAKRLFNHKRELASAKRNVHDRTAKDEFLQSIEPKRTPQEFAEFVLSPSGRQIIPWFLLKAVLKLNENIAAQAIFDISREPNDNDRKKAKNHPDFGESSIYRLSIDWIRQQQSLFPSVALMQRSAA